MCQEPLNHFYSKEMIELDLVLVDYSLQSDNGGSFFSSVVGFFFFWSFKLTIRHVLLLHGFSEKDGKIMTAA